MTLNAKDKALTRLYMAACFHRWALLPDLGRSCYQAGCTVEEVRGCVRHLVVVAGYGPCLAATNHLHAAKLLEPNTSGKIGGAPGNAFELVYAATTEPVRRRMHATDPTLCEWIRLHLYGDVYSSPGLQLRQKQLLMVAFLAEADMHEQLFGHLIAALRFGNDKEACLKAVDIGFELSPKPDNAVYKRALKMLQMAYHKFKKDHNPEHPAESPEVFVREPHTLRVPALVLSNGFDVSSSDDAHIASTFSTANLLSYSSIVAELPRTASEADILAHQREVGG